MSIRCWVWLSRYQQGALPKCGNSACTQVRVSGLSIMNSVLPSFNGTA